MVWRRHALDELLRIGGRGGLIAIDRNGQVSLEFTTSGMFRGAIAADGSRTIAIYGAPDTAGTAAASRTDARSTNAPQPHR